MSNKKLIKINIKEEFKYSKNVLLEKFRYPNNLDNILIQLNKYNIIHFVNSDDNSKNYNSNNNYIKFTFVGIIIIDSYIIFCYPKYVSNYTFGELKQIIKVIKRFQNNQDIVHVQQDINDENSFNLLPLILFFINDYYTNGLYSNIYEINEINGNGEILWNKTINHDKLFIQDNRPYYYELLTKNHVNDNNDYFRVLHKIILTKCSNDLKNADLLDLFGLTEINLTDTTINEFDNDENILNKINQEIYCQYNTRKIDLLNAMKLYILNKNSEFGLKKCFSLYGTLSYYHIWEKLCCYVLNDLKEKSLLNINLPISLNEKYLENEDLLSIIETPIWHSFNENGEFTKDAKKNKLKPDLITIYKYEDKMDFLIFDAKYYNLQLKEDLPLKGQPGIESVTKQYLYQLAYKEFITLHDFNNVKNCFLLPTSGNEVINKGFVKLNMLHDLELKDIQIILLPAMMINQLFLNNEKLDVGELKLY